MINQKPPLLLVLAGNVASKLTNAMQIFVCRDLTIVTKQIVGAGFEVAT